MRRLTLTIAILATLLLAPGTAHARGMVTRAVIHRELVRQHMPRHAWWERKLLHIVTGESHGNSGCVYAGHWGAWQFDRRWHLTRHMRRVLHLTHRHRGRSWQKCPRCSTARIVWVAKTSPHTVRSAWKATW
jgi:hypothetical protein